MALGMNCWGWRRKPFGSAGRDAVLSVLRHRYVREKQHAMRYRQHAERMSYPQFRKRSSASPRRRSYTPNGLPRKYLIWGKSFQM